MRAVVQSGFGVARDVLAIEEVDQPTVGLGEVLVRVKAAGVARGIWLITRGLPYIARPAYGFRKPRQPIAGLEFAGTVVARSEGIERFEVGDDVFGVSAGAFAETVSVPLEGLAPKPDGIGFEQAATAPISGLTALQAVRDGGQVEPGQHVLVLGASGGVGSYAVQIAKAFGAQVTGVASTRNLGLLRSLGVDHVVDYTREDPTTTTARYDVIIDMAGNHPVSRLRRTLTERGALVMVGGTGSRWTMGFERTIGGMLIARFVRHRIVGLLSKANQADLEVLATLMAEGKLSPVVQESFPLSSAAAAVEAAGTGHRAGTTVVAI